MSTTPRVLGGRYELGEQIGHGGMADVYLGHDTRLGRQVAIKMLRSDLARDATFLMRFRREAQAAAGLNHPFIVAIFDSGEDEGPATPQGGTTTIPYIVMEYVDGHTLREKLSEHRQFDPLEAIRVTEGILDALAYSHRSGIVHRDIKPANVMITESGAIKVMDFGIARAIADTAATMTHTQSVIGTANYLSPEQAQGQTVDERSDLYSTGCLLFELLTGRPPFTGDSPVAIAYQHVGEAPQPPSVWNNDVGGDLDAVTLHSLAKDREQRYQNADEFRRDLERVRLGRPISAAALGAAATMGLAAATQTLPQSYATPGAPTAVQPAVATRDANTAGMPAVGRYDHDDREREGGAGRAALVTVLVLLVLGLVGWGAVSWFNNQQSAVAQVTVPSLRGMSEQTAMRALATNKLQGEMSRAASPTTKEGQVIDQTPTAGLQVNEGTLVRFRISTGADSVTVPDVAGRDKELARTTLEAAGFTISQLQEENTPDREKDQVTRTEPAAGTSLGRGEPVKIFYATGNVAVPDNLVGQDWALVAVALRDAGVAPKRQDVDSDKPVGSVLEVANAGAVVKAGTEILVKVAKSPTPTPTTTTVTITPTPTPPPTTPPPTTPPPTTPPPTTPPATTPPATTTTGEEE